MTDGRQRVHVDANVILRLLLGEPEDQAVAEEALFERAAAGNHTVVLNPAVLAEVIYVLSSPRVASWPRADVVSVLRSVCMLAGVEVADRDVVLDALRMFAATRLDWVDCLLLSYTPTMPVYTFDGTMLKAGGTAVPRDR